MNHTFVICAYKESPYLEECIQSLFNQTIKTNIVMATSTPNSYIEDLSQKYKIPIYVNQNSKGIAEDWNFAYSCGETELVTIAHQDDIYLPNYTKNVVGKIERAENPLIVFTDYAELKAEKVIVDSLNLRIKRIMLRRLKKSGEKRRIKRSAIRWGNGICCPSVTFIKKNLNMPIFESHFRSNVDWQTWEKLSNETGEFIYCNEILMYHRIHDESETSAVIGENIRGTEDYEMFCKFWPSYFAKFLTKVYSFSEKGNT